MKPGVVRIIGGEWRRRQIKILDHVIRPTPDRVRETLFNWLLPYLPDAYCLDAFAGSGVLGFEALSRGAKAVVMVDQSPVVIAHLKATAITLQATACEIYQARVPQQLKPPVHPFNIVFLDPPYQANLLLPTAEYLETQGFLAEAAHIYLESKEVLTEAMLPKTWQLLKQQKAGQVHYYLAIRYNAL